MANIFKNANAKAAYNKTNKGAINWDSVGTKVMGKSGYGVGYATETVKLEFQYIRESSPVQSFIDGFQAGRDDAQYAFAQRAAKREAKAREQQWAKAAEAAAEEMINDMFDQDQSCFD